MQRACHTHPVFTLCLQIMPCVYTLPVYENTPIDVREGHQRPLYNGIVMSPEMGCKLNYCVPFGAWKSALLWFYSGPPLHGKMQRACRAGDRRVGVSWTVYHYVVNDYRKMASNCPEWGGNKPCPEAATSGPQFATTKLTLWWYNVIYMGGGG